MSGPQLFQIHRHRRSVDWWQSNGERLTPGDFQVVANLVDARDLSDAFLSHLLLEERSDLAFQNHLALFGFESQRVPLEMGIVMNGLLETLVQVIKAGRHDPISRQ